MHDLILGIKATGAFFVITVIITTLMYLGEKYTGIAIAIILGLVLIIPMLYGM
jgi:hypothetical protein